MTKTRPAAYLPGVLNDGDSELVDVDSIAPHDRNANTGDYGAIEQSIKENGFWGSLVCQRSTRKILCGNHRWLVAKNLGYKELPVTWLDCDSDTALRILLADNRTSRLGNDNPAALAELLTELAGTQRELAGTGFTGDDLDTLLNDLANPLGPTDPVNDPNAEWEGMPAYEHGDARPFRSLNVHFGSAEAVEEFGRLIGQVITDEAKWLWHPRQVRQDFMGERWAAREP